METYEGFTIGDRVSVVGEEHKGIVTGFRLIEGKETDGFTHFVEVLRDGNDYSGGWYPSSLKHLDPPPIPKDALNLFMLEGGGITNNRGEILCMKRSERGMELCISHNVPVPEGHIAAYSIDKSEIKEFLRKIEELLNEA